MKHFNDFLIKLQTLDIKVLQRPRVRDYQKSNNQYDISHQNPFICNDYKNELRELRELALTDILSLGIEQIGFQMKRLEETKSLFRTFWAKVYSPGNRRGGSRNDEFLANLDLTSIFIIPGIPIHQHLTVSNDFIFDIELTIEGRQKILEEFEQSVLHIVPLKTIKADGETPVVKPPERTVIKVKPQFKDGIAQDFFQLIKDYFESEDQLLLENLLVHEEEPGQPLLFKGRGIQLADAFKQLIEAQLIVGCLKKELINWIIKHFKFLNKGIPKSYSEKYLLDIISSNTKSCSDSILKVRVKEGKCYICAI